MGSQPATSPKMSNPFNSAPFNTDPSNSNMFLESTGMPVTLEQRNNQQQEQDLQQQQNSETHVTLPLETLQQLLSQNISFGSTENVAMTTMGQYTQSEGHGAMMRPGKRAHETHTQQEGQQQHQQVQQPDQKYGDVYSQIFSVPSPVAMSPIYVEQKPLSMSGPEDPTTYS